MLREPVRGWGDADPIELADREDEFQRSDIRGFPAHAKIILHARIWAKQTAKKLAYFEIAYFEICYFLFQTSIIVLAFLLRTSLLVAKNLCA